MSMNIGNPTIAWAAWGFLWHDEFPLKCFHWSDISGGEIHLCLIAANQTDGLAPSWIVAHCTWSRVEKCAIIGMADLFDY